MTFRPSRALVTGASSGIGAEFARALAARGVDLALVARRADRLQAIADELTAAFGVSVEVIPLDLTQSGVGDQLRRRTGAVDLVVNNAGFATHGPLVDADPDRLEREIDLDVRGLVSITRAYLPDLVAARAGGVVNVASTAAFQPVPTMAVYAAAKAFVLSFTRALWHEVRTSGVKVVALCPGATRTEFFEIVGTEAAAVGSFQSAAQVVAVAMRALDARRTPPHVISGAGNAFSAALTRFVPTRALLAVTARLVR